MRRFLINKVKAALIVGGVVMPLTAVMIAHTIIRPPKPRQW